MRVGPLPGVLVSSYEETGEPGLTLCSLPCEDTARILKQAFTRQSVSFLILDF